jgi:flagellar protein FlgJ
MMIGSAARPGTPLAPNVALMQQANGLEGVFLNTLTSQMFSSIKTDGMFGGGFGEQTWRSMQSEQMADAIAKSGGIGLAADITRNLLDAQQAAQAPAVLPHGAYAR